MRYCYPAPEYSPRWCQVSAQHPPCQKSSFPSPHYVGFIVKSQTITLSDTCQHAVRQEFFTSKTAYSAPSSADFALLSACPEGMDGVGRGRLTASFQAAFPNSLSWAGVLDLPQSSSKAQHQGRHMAGKPILESLRISLAAVGEVLCETHQAVARVQLAGGRTHSTARFRPLLWQHCDRSTTFVTSQQVAVAERPRSRIYIPQTWIFIMLKVLGHPTPHLCRRIGKTWCFVFLSSL